MILVLKILYIFRILVKKEESFENILEKINLVHEKSCCLDLELLINEELFGDTTFSKELF